MNRASQIQKMANQSNFEDKKKVLFDCLTSAEECIKGTSLEQKQIILDEPRSRHNRSAVGRRFHGKESIFKRPEAPLTKCLKPRHVPDYKVIKINKKFIRQAA